MGGNCERGRVLIVVPSFRELLGGLRLFSRSDKVLATADRHLAGRALVGRLPTDTAERPKTPLETGLQCAMTLKYRPAP